MARGLAWIALLCAAPAAAQAPPTLASPAVPSPAAASPAEPTAEEILLEFRDLADRMTVPVTIAGAGAGERGPWNFIVDTGAERTVVSRELASTLGLAAGPNVRVVAMTGPEWVPTVRVPALSVSRIAARGIVSPALGARDMGAVGMIGIDTLQDHSVVIDFARRRMTLKPSKRRRRPVGRDEVVVTAKSLYGQLIVTDARWRGKRIQVVVDTGTPVSLGNRALLRLMTNARRVGSMNLLSATGRSLTADGVQVQGIEVGGIGFSDVSLAIADAPPFARFGLSDTPALLMGMDLLRLFRGVQIDFANREIRFAMPPTPGVRVGGV